MLKVKISQRTIRRKVKFTYFSIHFKLFFIADSFQRSRVSPIIKVVNKITTRVGHQILKQYMLPFAVEKLSNN